MVKVSLAFSSNMAARLYRLGSIYSRIDGLMRKGLINEKDRPIWFDVYKSFPPKYEPIYNRKVPEIHVREIFYMEDTLRAKIHNVISNHINIINLSSNREIFSQKLLKTCQQYMSEGMSEEEALEKIKVSAKDLLIASKGSSAEGDIDLEQILKEVL